MGLRWITALFLCAVHVPLAAAGNAPPATERQVLEGKIAGLLSEKNTETTAFFEGCVLVVRLVHDLPVGGDTGWRQIDKRVDLALIEARPERVRITPPRDHPDYGLMPGSVTYSWRPDVERRMRVLQRLASDILDEAYAKFPSDVATRLTWIAAQHEEQLVDKIYLDAGERTHFGNGTAISRPITLSPRFLLEGQQATSFVELMYRYQESYCGERASA